MQCGAGPLPGACSTCTGTDWAAACHYRVTSCPAAPTSNPPFCTASPTTRSLSLLWAGNGWQQAVCAPGGAQGGPMGRPAVHAVTRRLVQPCHGRQLAASSAGLQSRLPSQTGRRSHRATRPAPALLKPFMTPCQGSHPMPTARPRSCLCEPAANCRGPRPSGTGTSGTHAVTVLSLPSGQ